MATNKQWVQELNKLISDNPDLEVFTMTDNEVCSSDDHRYWRGEITSIVKQEYFTDDNGSMYFEKEGIIDGIDSDCDLTDDEVESLYLKMKESKDIKEAIIIYIGT